MKKIISLMLVLMLLLSLAPQAFAEEEHTAPFMAEERQERFEARRARALEERAYQLSKAEKRAVKAAEEDEAMLFAAPIAFKEKVTITLPLQDSVTVDFKTPLKEWPDLVGYFEDEDGNVIEDCYVDAYCEWDYDEETGEEIYPSVAISYIDEWWLGKGEYSLYFEDWNTGKVYGPVTVLNPGYNFYGVLQAGKLNYLSYDFIDMLEKTPEKVDFGLVDENGRTVYEMDSLSVPWSDIYGFEISLFVPVSIENGTYQVETVIYYKDGTKEELIPNSVMAGNFAYVDNIDLLNDVYDEYTEKIYALVMYSELPVNLSEYELQLVDEEGNVVVATSECEIAEIWSDGIEAMYSLDASRLTADNYRVKVAYSGEKQFYCSYNPHIRKKGGESHYYPSVGMTKKVTDTNYLAITSGFDAGVHTVYSDYNCTTAIGTMTVEKGGMGEILLNKPATSNNICVRYGDDVEYIYLQRYSGNKAVTTISSVTPGFIGAGVKSITDFRFTIEDYACLSLEEIGDVTLEYNGATVAKGEDLEIASRGYRTSNRVFYARTNFTVDFSVSKTLAAGGTVTLKAETAYGDVSFDIPVISGTDSDHDGFSVNVLNTSYLGETMISTDPDNPNAYSYCSMVTGEDAGVSISNINRTSFTATLYKYNAKTYAFTKLKTLKSSSMTKSTVAGYAYYYEGEFANLDEGYYYVAVDDVKSDIFEVVTAPVINVEGGLIEYKEGYTYYAETVNVSSSDTIKAYYYNSSGTKKTLTIDKDVYDGYMYIGFDLSKVDFDAITVYMTVGTKVAGTVPVYNTEGMISPGIVNYQHNTDELYIAFDNMDMVDDPTLVVKAYGETALVKVLGETVLEKKLNFGSKDYMRVALSSLGLEDGVYEFYVTDGDRIVSMSTSTGVRAPKAVTKADVTVESVTTTSSRVTAKIKNNTSSTLKNIYLVVAGYNEEDIVVGVKTKKVTSISSGSSTSPYVDTIKDAETYEVYVWDGISTMKPLSK